MTAPQDVSGTLTSALSDYTRAQAEAVAVAAELAAEQPPPERPEDTETPIGE